MFIKDNIFYCKPDFYLENFKTNILNSPVSATILLLYGCNFKCSFCCNSSILKAKNIISIEQFQNIIEKLNYSMVTNITLTGGEVSLIEKLDEYLKICKQNNMKTIIITNGYEYGKNIEKFKKIEPYLDAVSISLHGNKETHNKITNTNSYKYLIKFIKYLSLDTKYTPNILFTASKTNYSKENLTSVIKIAQKYNCTVSVARANSIGGGKDIVLSIPDIQEIFRTIDKYSKKGVNIRFGNAVPLCILEPKYHKYLKNCHLGCGNISIKPNGDVGFCNQSQDAIGNIFETPIYKIWNNAKHQQIIDKCQKVRLQICQNCEFIISCKMGCKYETEQGYDYYLIEYINSEWDKIKNKKLQLCHDQFVSFKDNYYLLNIFPVRILSKEAKEMFNKFKTPVFPKNVINKNKNLKYILNEKYAIIDFYKNGGLYEISKN